MSTVFVTMIYNDPVFLDIWVRYYSKHTDRKNLHIVTHGSDQDYAYDIAKGCTFVECPRDPKNPALDRERFAWISNYCSELVKDYDRVVFNDVDEIVVLDPAHGGGLVDYIESIDPSVRVITPFGLELMHRKQFENDYDYDRGLFNQRRYIRASGKYSKPCITNTEITWGPDGHGCSHDTLFLDDNLYLFHLKWFDDQFHVRRHKDRMKMHFENKDGRRMIVGAGSWTFSEMEYTLATSGFMRYTDDKFDQGFDFTQMRERMKGGYIGNVERTSFKINMFSDNDFRILPERFIGLI